MPQTRGSVLLIGGSCGTSRIIVIGDCACRQRRFLEFHIYAREAKVAYTIRLH